MQFMSRVGAGLVGTLGLVVLTGWYTGTSALTTLAPGVVQMRPMTALSLILLAVGVAGSTSRLALVAGWAVTAIGGLTLIEFLTGASLGIDTLLPGIDLHGVDPRMAPSTAVSLVLLGTALLLVRRPTALLTVTYVTMGVGLLAILGYAYGASPLYTVGGFTSIAPHTALALVVLSVSILLQHPGRGLLGLIRDEGSPGRLLRPAIAFLAVGPFLLGWLRLWGERAGLYDTAIGVGILVAAMTGLGCGLTWIAGIRLRELDEQRDAAMRALAEINHTLEDTVNARTRELGESAEKLDMLIQLAPVGIVQLDAAGELISANQQWLTLTGLSHRDSLANGWAAAVHPDDLERVSAEWGVNVADGTAYETTLRFRTPAGQVNWVQVNTSPISDAGTVSGHLASITDVTAQRNAEAAAAAALARFEAAFASSPLGTAIVSLDGRVVEANRRLLDLTGGSSAVVDELIEGIFLPVAAAHAADAGAGTLDMPSTRQRLDRRMRRDDGEETWVKVSIAEIHDAEPAGGLLYQLEDITARRLAEARVEHLAFHDPLTSLPNRLLLLDRLNQALLQASRHGRGVAVLFIDLDRFKFVNDSLGHHAGDAVLTEVALRLRKHARATDTVSRIGGDEFVVICPNVGSSHDVHKIADTLQKAIARPIYVGDQPASVDASIGIAFGVAHDDAESLLRKADQAMYQAKGRGRARYEVFDDDLRGRIEQRLDTESALGGAVERGEIETWYQPIVDLQQRTVVATEALARWRRPGRGLIPPGDFIAIAEEIGLIRDLGATVLRQACLAAAARDGDLAVSVNVSARQFAQADFGAVVKRALRESGLPPEQLWLELTESAVLEAYDSAARTFQELRDQGIRLAIDDFGTGYSSFTHLREFTVDLLKIDLTFIRDVEQSEHDRAIVEGILRLADSLKLDVVAEGIETVSQRDLLQRMGCRYGQGYLFSRPLAGAVPVVVFGD